MKTEIYKLEYIFAELYQYVILNNSKICINLNLLKTREILSITNGDKIMKILGKGLVCSAMLFSITLLVLVAVAIPTAMAAAPAADFSSNVYNDVDMVWESFTDTSTGSPASWLWEYRLADNGAWITFSTEQNPTDVEFGTAGTYDIRLTATNADGNDTMTKYHVFAVATEHDYLSTVINGTVSGGLYVDSVNAWPDTTDQPSYNYTQSYTLPACGSDIVWARVFVNDYSGSGTDNKPVLLTTEFDADGDGTFETPLGEETCDIQSEMNGHAYPLNDHVTKVYSDYEVWYNVTNLITSTTPKVRVTASNVPGETLFDGRIKGITLIVAYNDGDSDQVKYWVNHGCDWMTGDSSTVFDTSTLASGWSDAELRSVAFSSTDAGYTLNDGDLTKTALETGSYYKYNSFNVTDGLSAGSANTFGYTNGDSSFKICLATLAVEYQADINLDATSATVDTAPSSAIFAWEPNTVQVKKIKNTGTDTAGNITVALYASDVSTTVPVATTTIASLAGGATAPPQTIIDPTIRDHEGGTVTYSVVLDPDNLIAETDENDNNQTSGAKSLRYNGYKGKGIYWAGSNNSGNITTKHTFDITGDVIYSTQPESAYKSVWWLTRTETWTAADLPIPATATVEKVYLYFTYNWDQTEGGYPNLVTTFNGNAISLGTPYRDWSNFGTYADYKYGLYPAVDVTSIFNVNGDNTLVTNPGNNGEDSQLALYPSTLVVVYSDPNETRKLIFINEECDELGFSQSNYGTTVEEATAYVEFSGLDIDLSRVQNATLHSFAGSAGSNEGNLLFNGQSVATNAWQGTSKTASAQPFNVTDYLTADGNIAGVQGTTGGGMAALQQILVVEYAQTVTPVADLNVSDIAVFHNSYEGAWEGLNNTVNVTVINEGTGSADNFFLELSANDTLVESKTVSDLSAGESTVVSFTWKAGEGTYTLKAVADPENAIIETDETNNEYSIDQLLQHNGYAGDQPLTTYAHGNVRGDVIYDYGDSYYKSGFKHGDIYTVNHTLDLPEGATVKLARLYTYWTYCKADPSDIKLNFNGTDIEPENIYTDSKGWGSYSYPYGTFAYNITDSVAGNGNYLTTVVNNNTDTSKTVGIYGVSLLVVYEGPDGQDIEYWINEGADLLYSNSKYSGGLTSEEATATAAFGGSVDLSGIESARLWTIVPSGNKTGNTLHFNDMEWSGVYNGTPYNDFDVDEERDVKDYLIAENNLVRISAASPEDGGDTLMPCGAILAVTHQDYVDLNVSDIAVFHNSYEGAWEGLNNTVNVTVINEGTGSADNFFLELSANDTLVESKTVSDLSAGESTVVSFTWKAGEGTYTLKAVADPENAIIETDETNNEYSIDQLLQHNGYAGDQPLTTYAHGNVRGDVIYDYGDSYYKSGFKHGDIYTVNHTLDLPEGATVKLARLYTYWTYCKADPSDIKLNFNGTDIEPENIYTDSKGWGSYSYPYGTFAYNITDSVAGNGNYLTTVVNNNTDTSKTVGIYGVSLLVVYEGPDGQDIEYWINEGADLLYSNSKYSGGLTSEEATATAAFGGSVDLSGIESARLWTIVPSGNKTGNTLHFNDMEWSGVYNGTPYNDFDVDEERDVKDYLIAENNLVRISAASPEDGGDTLMPCGAILVVETDSNTLPVLSFMPADATVIDGQTSEIVISVDSLPAGLAGYNLTVDVGDRNVSTIVNITYPEWVSMSENSTLSSGSIYLKALDENETIQAGATDVVLATLTVKGKQLGNTSFTLGINRLDDDNGDEIEAILEIGTLEVTMTPMPGQENSPQDLDGDGVYEDLSGDGSLSFVDVELFFHQMDWIETHLPIANFDFNSNGRIDFDDVVDLFQMVM
jgi:subtilase family serine protease